MSNPGGYERSIHLEPDSEPLTGYRLLSSLGAGGFGEVWRAEAPGGFTVALKFVRLDKGASVEERSLAILKHLRHPNLLTPFGSWQVGGFLIVAMELADGSLWDRYQEARDQGLPGIPREELLEFMFEAAKGIDYLNAHRHDLGDGRRVGIQHRDLKPQNILISGGGVKVADFGLSRLLENSVTGHTGSLTPSFAAPEFFDHQTADQSDQYSLAVTYCLLRGGKLPFRGTPVQVMAAHLQHPPDLTMLPKAERPVVGRAMAKAPTDRWPHCRSFVEELRSADHARGFGTVVIKDTVPSPSLIGPDEPGPPPPAKTEVDPAPSRKPVRQRPARVKVNRVLLLFFLIVSALSVVATLSYGAVFGVLAFALLWTLFFCIYHG